VELDLDFRGVGGKGEKKVKSGKVWKRRRFDNTKKKWKKMTFDNANETKNLDWIVHYLDP